MTDTVDPIGLDPVPDDPWPYVVEPSELRAQLGVDNDDPNTVRPFIGAAQNLVEGLIDKPMSDYFDDAEQAFTVPDALRQAIVQTAAAMFEERDRFTIPAGVHELVAPFRSWAF